MVRSERDEYVAAFALLAAIGKLTTESLDLPVEHYDPATITIGYAINGSALMLNYNKYRLKYY